MKIKNKTGKTKNMFKGQFFILGAVLMIIMFSIGIPFIKPSLSMPAEDLPYLSDNVRLEFPAAFNLGLNESNELSAMSGFSNFLNETLHDRFVEFSALWLYTKNQTRDVNMTIGNYLNQNTTVTLTISSTEKEVFVQNRGSNTTLFTNPGSIFNLTIEFNSRSKTAELLRDKNNLYVFYELKREKDKINEEIVA